jgi:hypothetical protein
MATSFMAAPRMRILRLFITNNLEVPLNWALVEEDASIHDGVSKWDELSVMEGVHLEVYLSIDCCSIHKISTVGIKMSRLNEIVVLSMLEDDIVDDIEEVTPIIMKTEEDVAYVAVFNKQFYEGLLLRLVNLGKPVRFMQAFAFCTNYSKNNWTIYADKTEYFVRTSLYEYFMLDNGEPVSILLDEMLTKNQPDGFIIYGDNALVYKEYLEKKFDIPCQLSNEIKFGENVWNFYNQKSTRFHFRLDKLTRLNLLVLLRTVRWISIMLVMFWLLDVVMVSGSIRSTEADIRTNLSKIYPIDKINSQAINEIYRKINSTKHSKGLYEPQDVIPLFNEFLDTVSNVGTNSIVQLNYQNEVLEVFLNSSFDAAQFNSYKNILLSHGINARLVEYKDYKSDSKANSQSENNPDANSMQSRQINAKWVIVLERDDIFDVKKGQR